MKIGSDYDLFYLWDRWAKAASEWGLDADALHERVVEIARRIPGAFVESAAEPEVAGLGRKGPGRLVDAVAGRAGRCLRQLI